MCEWCGEGVSFGVERDGKCCQFRFNLTMENYKKRKPRSIMVTPDQKTVKFPIKNKHRPTIILTTITNLDVKGEKLGNMMHNIKTSPIKHVAQRERECCKQMKKKRESGQEIDGIVSGTGSAHVQVFLQGYYRCFTSTVAVCSRRVG